MAAMSFENDKESGTNDIKLRFEYIKFEIGRSVWVHN